MGGSWISRALKRRKLLKLEEKFFKQNGGLMLQQQLFNHRGPMRTNKIFSAEELEKATNNYDESRVIGIGGYGIVYKGVFPNNTVVAIKKFKVKLIDPHQIECFINEVIMLNAIDHSNVVKLLGYCLKTEIPMLVYEFISNGTLYNHIHNESLSLSWEKRLKIAAEIAGVLEYLHSSTSMKIVHRDVKTTNILLDDNYMTKVIDFGSSKQFPLDQTQLTAFLDQTQLTALLDRTHLTTLVYGTFGYLDPEYFHTNRLTEKSDVYSFGIVLMELLTGEKAISFDRPEGEKNLVLYFISAIEEDRILQILEDHIVNEGNVEELMEVANLAKRCVRIRGEARPTMKEVAMQLEGLIIMRQHP